MVRTQLVDSLDIYNTSISIFKAVQCLLLVTIEPQYDGNVFGKHG